MAETKEVAAAPNNDQAAPQIHIRNLVVEFLIAELMKFDLDLERDIFPQVVQHFVEDYLLKDKPLPADILGLLKKIDSDRADKIIQALFEAPKIEKLADKINGRDIFVVRDDELSTNHTKARALLYLFSKEEHIVAPFASYVSLGIAECAKLMGKTVTFVIDESRIGGDVAQRAKLIGGRHVQFLGVSPPGEEDSTDYVIQESGKAADRLKAFHLPISADLPVVIDILSKYAGQAEEQFRQVYGGAPDIVCVASGKCVLSRAFQKGMSSIPEHWAIQFVPQKYAIPERAKLFICPRGFLEEAAGLPPFPTNHVDAKSWEMMCRLLNDGAPKSGKVLFWNVAPGLQPYNKDSF
jgi:hypothetical protein